MPSPVIMNPSFSGMIMPERAPGLPSDQQRELYINMCQKGSDLLPVLAEDLTNLVWMYIGGGHGIKLRARATIRDVSIQNCSGNGVHIEAQDPELPAAVAIADGWLLDNVNVYGCDGHGYYMNGSNAHAGVATGGFLNANGQQAGNYGIYDSSFR